MGFWLSHLMKLITVAIVGLAFTGQAAAEPKMYWTDFLTNTIHRANLDGSGVEDIVTVRRLEGGGPNERGVAGVAVDVAGSKMYWHNNGLVQRANLDGSGVEDLVVTEVGVMIPDGFRAVDIALDVAGGKMYWTDLGTKKIQRANLDGTSVEDLLTAESSPRIIFPKGIALDLGDIPEGEDSMDNGDSAADITWAVTGVDVDVVVCKNKTTGQKGRIDVGVPTSGSCGDLGLVWDAGDNVQVKAVGTVVSVADAGGSVTGITASLLVCKNRSSDPEEKVRVDNPGLSWKCSDEGLPLAVGERLQWKAKGLAN